MSEPAVNIVVSQSVEDILALVPKPKMEKLEKKLTQTQLKSTCLAKRNRKRRKRRLQQKSK